jgi:hypothetical protein
LELSGQLYPWGKSPQYPLDGRLGGPQNRSGRRGEAKILDPTGTQTPTPRPSSSYVIIIIITQFFIYLEKMQMKLVATTLWIDSPEIEVSPHIHTYTHTELPFPEIEPAKLNFHPPYTHTRAHQRYGFYLCLLAGK